MEGLVEGRIVHYVAYNGRCLAGMIIGCDKGRNNLVDLVIFTNLENVNGIKNYGMQFHTDVQWCALIEGETKYIAGTWHWPERS